MRANSMFYIVYLSIFKIYAWRLKQKHSEVTAVWYRNSFRLGYWSFGKSDIDITVLINKSDRSIIENITKTHNLIKKILPIIGEIVFFNEKLKEPLFQTINSLELKRDPELMNRFSLSKPTTESEKSLYLHKFLQANWEKFGKLELRIEKIHYLLASLSMDTPNFSQNAFILTLSELTKSDSSIFLKEYHYYSVTSADYNSPPPTIAPIYCLFFNKICYLPFEGILTPLDKELLENTVRWDFWGCYSNQTPGNEHQIKLHLANMFEKLKIYLAAEKVEELLLLAVELGLITTLPKE